MPCRRAAAGKDGTGAVRRPHGSKGLACSKPPEIHEHNERQLHSRSKQSLLGRLSGRRPLCRAHTGTGEEQLDLSLRAKGRGLRK